MLFRRKYKRAMEVMRLRNKEYLDKMNADNPDWDKENGAFYSDETPAENKAGSDIPETDAEGDTPERGGDELPAETEKTSEGKKKRKKKKKRGSWKEKGDDYKNVMEKGDLSAIILSAFMVFGPIFLVLILIMLIALLVLR